MLKKFDSVLFYANDLGKTLDFYLLLGFEASLRDGTVRVELGSFGLTFVDENQTPIRRENGARPKGLGVFTYIEVDDVDAYSKLLKEKNIRASSEPHDWPWGKREFAVKDPDGYKLIFYSPLKR